MKKLSVVIPALNEEAAIERVLQSVPVQLLKDMAGLVGNIELENNGSVTLTIPSYGFGHNWVNFRASGLAIVTDYGTLVVAIPYGLDASDVQFVVINKITDKGCRLNPL